MRQLTLEKCHICGGTVEAVAIAGRLYEYRGVTCKLPSTMEIPTCNVCGRQWVGPELLRQLSAELERQRQLKLSLLLNAKESVVTKRPVPAKFGAAIVGVAGVGSVVAMNIMRRTRLTGQAQPFQQLHTVDGRDSVPPLPDDRMAARH